MSEKFMFVLYGDDSYWESADEEAIAADMQRHEDFTAAVAKAGAKIVGGEALQPSKSAALVRNDGAHPVVTDGPFLESKEALGGYYVIEAADRHQAIELAKLCPTEAVEVRPVIDFD